MKNPDGKGHELACAWDHRVARRMLPGSSSERSHVFTQKSDRAEESCNTDTQREGKTKGKADTEDAGQIWLAAMWCARGVGQ